MYGDAGAVPDALALRDFSSAHRAEAVAGGLRLGPGIACGALRGPLWRRCLPPFLDGTLSSGADLEIVFVLGEGLGGLERGGLSFRRGGA